MNLTRILLAALALSCFVLQMHSQDNPHHVATDPAISEMLKSLDMPRPFEPAGTVLNVPSTNLAGNWHLILSDGTIIDLTLFQSGNMIFGRGSVSTGTTSQWATAGGSASGRIVRLDIVPASGTKMYEISMDLGQLPLVGTYMLVSNDAEPKSGNVKAGWLAA